MSDPSSSTYPADEYPECAAAREMGVDIDLLVSSLRLTPAERIREMARTARTHQKIQLLNLPSSVLGRLYAQSLQSKIKDLGPELSECDRDA